METSDQNQQAVSQGEAQFTAAQLLEVVWPQKADPPWPRPAVGVTFKLTSRDNTLDLAGPLPQLVGDLRTRGLDPNAIIHNVDTQLVAQQVTMQLFSLAAGIDRKSPLLPDRMLMLKWLELRVYNARVAKMLWEQPSMATQGVDGNHVPLQGAAWVGAADVVDAALASGTDADAKGYVGMTALHCAAANGHVGIVARLLRHGVAVNVENDYGMRAQDLAVLNKQPRDIVSFITRAGGEDISSAVLESLFRRHGINLGS